MMNKIVTTNTNRNSIPYSNKQFSKSFDDIEISTNIFSSTPSDIRYTQNQPNFKKNRFSISFGNNLNSNSDKDSSNLDQGSYLLDSSGVSHVELKLKKSTNHDLDLLTPTCLEKNDFLDFNQKSQVSLNINISKEELTLLENSFEDGCLKKSHVCNANNTNDQLKKSLSKSENKSSLTISSSKLNNTKSKVCQKFVNIEKEKNNKQKHLNTVKSPKDKISKKNRKNTVGNVTSQVKNDNSKIIKADKSNCCEHINLLDQLSHATKGFEAFGVLIQHLVFDLKAYRVSNLEKSLEEMKYNYSKLEEELKKSKEECEKLRRRSCNGLSTINEQNYKSLKVTLETNQTELINTKRDFDQLKELYTKSDNELKSIQTVLDLKMAELCELRQKSNNLQRENEQLKTISMKVLPLESKIQKLEVQITVKAEHEQHLMLDNRKKDEELNLQQNKIREQARVIEQLRYKIQRKSGVHDLLCNMSSPLKQCNSNRYSNESFTDNTSIIRGRESARFYSTLDNSQMASSLNETICSQKPCNPNRNSTGSCFETSSILPNCDTTLFHSILNSPEELSPESSRVKSYVEKSASASWVLEIDDFDCFQNSIINKAALINGNSRSKNNSSSNHKNLQ